METSFTQKNINKVIQSPYLTRRNLELVFGPNRRTLDYRIKSLINKNYLVKVKQGFYISTQYMEKEPNPQLYLEFIGGILKEPSYVSLEYALAKYNLIPESVFDITYVTTQKTDKFVTSIGAFIYKSICNRLYLGFENIQYKDKIISFAYPYKAIFDLFYYANFNNKDSIKDYVYSSRINWQNLDKSNLRQLKKLMIDSKIKKMQILSQVLTQENIL